MGTLKRMSGLLLISFILGASAQPASAAPPTPTPASDCITLGSQKTAARPADRAKIRDCIQSGLPQDFQAGMADQILQTVAQVVIDRATQSAWDLLTQQMKQWLDCTGEARRFTNTCTLLGPLRMQELVAAPDTLVSAFAADLLAVVERQFKASGAGGTVGTGLKPESPAPPAMDAVVARLAGAPPAAATAEAAETFKAQREAEMNQFMRSLVSQTLKASGELLHVFFRNFMQNWKRSGMKNAMAGAEVDFKNVLLNQLTKAAAENQCMVATSAPAAWGAVLTTAEWVVGRCLLSRADSGAGAARIASCDIDELLKLCNQQGGPVLSESVQQRIREYVSVFKATLATSDAQSALRLPFMAARDLKPVCDTIKDKPQQAACEDLSNRMERTIDALESLVLGVFNKDFIKITAGIADLVTLADSDVARNSDAYVKALRAVTAISQLAYHSKSTEADAKARREVLENLMKSLVNRSNRVGWVVSLGGSFGVAAAYRAAIDDLGTPGLQAPFALPLGFGVQYYQAPGHDYGFHLQISVLDIGQYVAWDGKDFSVKTPNLQDAVSFSVQTGLWFGSRNVPLFVGPHFGVAPFARGGTPSLFAGGMFGAYVPFLDLN